MLGGPVEDDVDDDLELVEDDVVDSPVPLQRPTSAEEIADRAAAADCVPDWRGHGGEDEMPVGMVDPMGESDETGEEQEEHEQPLPQQQQPQPPQQQPSIDEHLSDIEDDLEDAEEEPHSIPASSAEAVQLARARSHGPVGEVGPVVPAGIVASQPTFEETENPMALAQSSPPVQAPAPAASGAPAPAAADPRVLQVQVPAGAGPGSHLRVRIPNGQIVTIRVPTGAAPGTLIRTPLPDDAAAGLPAPAPDAGGRAVLPPLPSVPAAADPAVAVDPAGVVDMMRAGRRGAAAGEGARKGGMDACFGNVCGVGAVFLFVWSTVWFAHWGNDGVLKTCETAGYQSWSGNKAWREALKLVEAGEKCVMEPMSPSQSQTASHCLDPAVMGMDRAQQQLCEGGARWSQLQLSTPWMLERDLGAMDDLEFARLTVRGPTTWTITHMMALIISDCGTMRSPGIKWPESPRTVRPAGVPKQARAVQARAPPAERRLAAEGGGGPAGRQGDEAGRAGAGLAEEGGLAAPAGDERRHCARAERPGGQGGRSAR